MNTKRAKLLFDALAVKNIWIQPWGWVFFDRHSFAGCERNSAEEQHKRYINRFYHLCYSCYKNKRVTASFIFASNKRLNLSMLKNNAGFFCFRFIIAIWARF